MRNEQFAMRSVQCAMCNVRRNIIFALLHSTQTSSMISKYIRIIHNSKKGLFKYSQSLLF